MISNNLQGKNILFFGPKTFNYHNEIIGGLTEMGASVTYCSDKPFKAVLLIALLRLKPKWAWWLANRFYYSWLKNEAPVACDIVFVIKGEGLSPQFLYTLKCRYQNASFILYLWDSISNVKHVQDKFSLFDNVLSFDPEDCKNIANLKYRALFFLGRYYNPIPVPGKGVFFIGTLNGDRTRVLKELSKFLSNKQPVDFWLFVRSKIELYLSSVFDSALYSGKAINLLIKPMSVTEINDRINNCAAVLDIEHPKQKGLTMRTFEVLASGKKLITTNKSILNHEFFDPSRIAVIDRNNPVIDTGFFDLTNKPLPDFFINKYSLKGWLFDILEENN